MGCVASLQQEIQMHIAEVETFGRGGLAHYVHNLSVALAERGHDVSLLTAASYELEGWGALPANVSVIREMGRASRAFGGSLPGFAMSLLRKVEAIRDAFAVAKLLRRLDPDLVHFHCTNRIAVLFLSRLARLPCPLVVTAHVVTPHEPIRWQSAIYGRVHEFGELIVAHSEFDRKRLLEEFAVDPERVTVIPHGEYGFFERLVEPVPRLNARQALGLGPQEDVVLFFGYIREYKGLDILLDAWPKVAARQESARLVVAGDAVQLPTARRRELEHWADRLGAIHRFEYIPFEDVTGYFSAADVVVMPYRRLSHSGVLFLALSLGVPVVATSVGALSEMLRDGETGLLVPPESPSELADAIDRLLGDEELRRRLSRDGCHLAAEYAWPTIAARTEEAFRYLLGTDEAQAE